MILSYFQPHFDEHLQRLTIVLSCMRDAGLQFNAKNIYRLPARTIQVLGYLVSKERIQPDPDKILAVSDMLRPTTQKKLCSFIGLCS